MGFLGAVGSVAGSIIGSRSQANANQVNQQMSQEQMKFQKYMSDTSVQRRVEDMKKAGINPLLSVSGASAGASTPQGASATAQSTFDPSVMANLLTSVANASVAKAQKEKLESETVSQESNQRKVDIENLKNQLSTQVMTNQDRRALEAHIKLLEKADAEIGSINANTSFVASKNRAFNTDYANTPEGQKQSHYSNVYGGAWKTYGQVQKSYEENTKKLKDEGEKIVNQVQNFFKGRSNARR